MNNLLGMIINKDQKIYFVVLINNNTLRIEKICGVKT